MKNLPNEVIIQILSYLPYQYLVKSVSFLNQRFYNLSKLNFLWKPVFLRVYHRNCWNIQKNEEEGERLILSKTREIKKLKKLEEEKSGMLWYSIFLHFVKNLRFEDSDGEFRMRFNRAIERLRFGDKVKNDGEIEEEGEEDYLEDGDGLVFYKGFEGELVCVHSTLEGEGLLIVDENLKFKRSVKIDKDLSFIHAIRKRELLFGISIPEGKLVAHLMNKEYEVICSSETKVRCVYSPDRNKFRTVEIWKDRRFVTFFFETSFKSALLVHSIDDLTIKRTLIRLEKGMYCGKFLQKINESYIAILKHGGKTHTIEVWNLKTKKKVATKLMPKDYLDFKTSGNKILISRINDVIVWTWKTNKGKLLKIKDKGVIMSCICPFYNPEEKKIKKFMVFVHCKGPKRGKGGFVKGYYVSRNRSNKHCLKLGMEMKNVDLFFPKVSEEYSMSRMRSVGDFPMKRPLERELMMVKEIGNGSIVILNEFSTSLFWNRSHPKKYAKVDLHHHPTLTGETYIVNLDNGNLLMFCSGSRWKKMLGSETCIRVFEWKIKKNVVKDN